MTKTQQEAEGGGGSKRPRNFTKWIINAWMIGSWKIRPWLMRLLFFSPKYNEDKSSSLLQDVNSELLWITPTTQERGKEWEKPQFSLFKCATITLKFIQFRKQLVSKCDGKKEKKKNSLLRLSGLLTHSQMVQLTSSSACVPTIPSSPSSL